MNWHIAARVAVIVAVIAAVGLGVDIAVAGLAQASGLAGVIVGFCELGALVLGVGSLAAQHREADRPPDPSRSGRVASGERMGGTHAPTFVFREPTRWGAWFWVLLSFIAIVIGLIGAIYNYVEVTPVHKVAFYSYFLMAIFGGILIAVVASGMFDDKERKLFRHHPILVLSSVGVRYRWDLRRDFTWLWRDIVKIKAVQPREYIDPTYLVIEVIISGSATRDVQLCAFDHDSFPLVDICRRIASFEPSLLDPDLRRWARL